MFPIGTQISVVLSSANKKLSPRCGSVGYVSGIGQANFLTTDYESGLIATPMSIIFTKYGNESRFRREKRVILNVIPIETHNAKQNTEANIEKLRNILNKKSIFIKRHIESSGAICAGTVIPNNIFHNIMESKKIEINAWVNSHMDHYYFRKTLPNILKQLNYTPGFISQLQTNYSELNLQDVILSLRAASTMYSVRNYANYLSVFKQALTKTSVNYRVAYNEFFNMYIKDLFDKEKSIEKEVIVKKYASNKSQHITASNMNKMSVALTKLNHSKGA